MGQDEFPDTDDPNSPDLPLLGTKSPAFEGSSRTTISETVLVVVLWSLIFMLWGYCVPFSLAYFISEDDTEYLLFLGLFVINWGLSFTMASEGLFLCTLNRYIYGIRKSEKVWTDEEFKALKAVFDHYDAQGSPSGSLSGQINADQLEAALDNRGFDTSHDDLSEIIAKLSETNQLVNFADFKDLVKLASGYNTPTKKTCGMRIQWVVVGCMFSLLLLCAAIVPLAAGRASGQDALFNIKVNKGTLFTDLCPTADPVTTNTATAVTWASGTYVYNATMGGVYRGSTAVGSNDKEAYCMTVAPVLPSGTGNNGSCLPTANGDIQPVSFWALYITLGSSCKLPPAESGSAAFIHTDAFSLENTVYMLPHGELDENALMRSADTAKRAFINSTDGFAEELNSKYVVMDPAPFESAERLQDDVWPDFFHGFWKTLGMFVGFPLLCLCVCTALVVISSGRCPSRPGEGPCFGPPDPDVPVVPPSEKVTVVDHVAGTETIVVDHVAGTETQV